MKAKTLEQVVAAEAGGKTRRQRLTDMKNIYSSMVNRAIATGVAIKDVFSVTSQYNAYNKAMPPGTPALTDLAKEAVAYVDAYGVTHPGMYYATPAAVANLPAGLEEVTGVGGVHKVFVDPKNRAVITKVGARPVNPTRLAASTPAEMTAPGFRPDMPSAANPSPEVAEAVAAAMSDPSRAQEAIQAQVAGAFADPSRRLDLASSTAPAAIDTATAPRAMVDSMLSAPYNKNPLPAAQHVLGVDPKAVEQALAQLSTQGVRPAPAPSPMPAAPAPAVDPLGFKTPVGPVALTNPLTATLAATFGPTAAPAPAARPAPPTPDTGLPAAKMTPDAALSSMASPARAPVDVASIAGPQGDFTVGPGLKPTAATPASMPTADRFGSKSVAQQVAEASRSASAMARPGVEMDTSAARMADPATAGPDKALRDAMTGRLAEQYGSYRTPTNYDQVREKMAAAAAAPPATTTKAAPPAAPAQKAATMAGTADVSKLERDLEARNELENIKDASLMGPMPAKIDIDVPESVVEEAPPDWTVETAYAPTSTRALPQKAAPAPVATAGDVYSGKATEGLDSVGNTVTRDALGRTAVTNKYGKTTAMVNGKQAAISGPLAPAEDDPNEAITGGLSKKGTLSKGFSTESKAKMKELAGGVLGAVLGGAAFGPIGAAIGAKAGSVVTGGIKPNSILGQAMGLNKFPGAPTDTRPGAGSTGFRSQADRDRAEGMSPKARADIDAGKAGLF